MLFYRCRISTEERIPIEEMGAPPIEKTTDGRANERGLNENRPRNLVKIVTVKLDCLAFILGLKNIYDLPDQ